MNGVQTECAKRAYFVAFAAAFEHNPLEHTASPVFYGRLCTFSKTAVILEPNLGGCVLAPIGSRNLSLNIVLAMLYSYSGLTPYSSYTWGTLTYHLDCLEQISEEKRRHQWEN
eukprot:6480217-Amphidinium_carterae.1